MDFSWEDNYQIGIKQIKISDFVPKSIIILSIRLNHSSRLLQILKSMSQWFRPAIKSLDVQKIGEQWDYFS